MVVFVGTSAGEQFPGVWCNCPNCKRSRELGGKNIRRNASMYIEPNILIDFPPGIPDQALKACVELPEIEHLFITHDHADHFTPWFFQWRHFPKDRKLPPQMGDFGPLFSEPELLKPNAKFVITHTGPHHAPPYEDCVGILAEMGLILAYDGMKLEE